MSERHELADDERADPRDDGHRTSIGRPASRNGVRVTIDPHGPATLRSDRPPDTF